MGPCQILRDKQTFLHRPSSQDRQPQTDGDQALPTRHVLTIRLLHCSKSQKVRIKFFFLQTENTEKYEIDENSEFLQPVDSAPPVIVDEDDYQVHENCSSIDHDQVKERL